MPIPNHVDGRKGLLDGEHLRRHHTLGPGATIRYKSLQDWMQSNTPQGFSQRKIYWQNQGSSNSASDVSQRTLGDPRGPFGDPSGTLGDPSGTLGDPRGRIHGSAAPCRVHLQDTNDHLPTLSWTFAAHPVRSGKAFDILTALACWGLNSYGSYGSCGNCIWFLIQFACEIWWTATGCSNLKQTWTPRFPAFEGDALRSLARHEHMASDVEIGFVGDHEMIVNWLWIRSDLITDGSLAASAALPGSSAGQLTYRYNLVYCWMESCITGIRYTIRI